MYNDGTTVPKDPAQARTLFTRACNMNNGQGCTAIGNTQKGCTLGDRNACDTLCRSGNEGSCAHASKEVQEEVNEKNAKQRATARFPGLLVKCEANRVVVERLKVAAFAAARSGNQDRAAEATQRLRDFDATWSATMTELQKVTQLMSDGQEPRLGQLALQVRNRCACDADPRRPGGWCRRY
jgi:hypothetical protein